MTPEEVGNRLATLLADSDADAGPVAEAPAGPVAGVSGGQEHARATVDVPPARWRDALLAARDDAELACDFFDWLSAVDELADGFDVIAHLWSTTKRHGVLIRTRVPRDQPRVASVVDVYPGAAWHERETYEMFGISFAGHDDLRPLLLPPGFEGHPLRKEFVLASRVAKPWPGREGAGGVRGGRRTPADPPAGCARAGGVGNRADPGGRRRRRRRTARRRPGPAGPSSPDPRRGPSRPPRAGRG